MTEKFSIDDILRVERKPGKRHTDEFFLQDFEFEYLAFGYWGKIDRPSNRHGISVVSELDPCRVARKAEAGISNEGKIVYTIPDANQGNDEYGDYQVIIPYINDNPDLLDYNDDPIPLGARIAIEDLEHFVYRSGRFVFEDGFDEIEKMAESLGLNEYYENMYSE